jgi:hypothetical protein
MLPSSVREENTTLAPSCESASAGPFSVNNDAPVPKSASMRTSGSPICLAGSCCQGAHTATPATRASADERRIHGQGPEVYLKLIDVQNVALQGKAHFFAIWAQMMRRILVDGARKRAAVRLGGGLGRIHLDDVAI